MTLNPMLLMTLLNSAPALKSAISTALGKGLDINKTFPNITTALENQYDPNLIEANAKDSLDTLKRTEELSGLYSQSHHDDSVMDIFRNLDKIYDTTVTKPFPSANDTQNDIQAIANGLSLGEHPAQILAGRMLSYPEQQIPDDESSQFWMGNDGLKLRDEDFLHSSELWESGLGYKEPYSTLYKNLVKGKN